MLMFRVLLVSHGGLAMAMLKSAEMIAGSQKDVKTLCLFPEDAPESFRDRIAAVLEEWKAEDVLVLSDIRSGTPFNAVASLMQRYPFRHISGVNLAMLIEALMDRDDMSAEKAGNEIMKLSGQTVLDVNTLLEK
jgi:PTS system mannose-specific IIA component